MGARGPNATAPWHKHIPPRCEGQYIAGIVSRVVRRLKFQMLQYDDDIGHTNTFANHKVKKLDFNRAHPSSTQFEQDKIPSEKFIRVQV